MEIEAEDEWNIEDEGDDFNFDELLEKITEELILQQGKIDEILMEGTFDQYWREINSRISEGDVYLPRKLPGHIYWNYWRIRTDFRTWPIIKKYPAHDSLWKDDGHPGGRKIYCKLRRLYYLPELAVELYDMVRSWTECDIETIKRRKYLTQIKMFPAAEPL